MKKLLELEARLRKAKEELEKSKKISFHPKTMVMTPHSDTHMKVYHGDKQHIMSDSDAHAYSEKHGGPSQKKHGVSLVNHARETGMSFENQDAADGHPSEADQKAAHALKGKPIKARLKKNAMMGYGNDAQTGMPAGTADVNMAKEEHCSDEDKKADKKMIEDKMDEHNEKMHGEAKDKDSAKKSDYDDLQTTGTGESTKIKPTPENDTTPVDVKIKENTGKSELIKFGMNGQWSLMGKAQMDDNKTDSKSADVADQRPNGEFDVEVKDVYDGDDAMDHAGNRSVDGSDKGKTVKESETEKKLLKD